MSIPVLAQTISLLLQAMRPRQWAKNLIIFAPIIFAAQLTNLKSLIAVTLYFMAFCAASSSVYLLNDVFDRKLDRAHPYKSKRPIASGRIGLRLAITTSICLALIALAISLFVRPSLLLITLTYIVLTLLYSLFLKHLVIVDVMAISSGFLLRAIGGGFAAMVPISGWFLVCTSFGSLFLALEKRRRELASLHKTTEGRPVLTNYSENLLDRVEAIVLPTLLISYILYSFLSYHGQWMLITVPFVFYGIVHYQRLSIKGDLTESPEEILLQDGPMQLTLTLWLATSLGVLYGIIPKGFSEIVRFLDGIKLI